MKTDPTATEKVCRKCLILHPLEDYHLNAKSGDGKHSWCKACVLENVLKHKREKRAAYREENNLKIGERVRGRNKSFTNLSPEEQVLHDVRVAADIVTYQREYHRQYQLKITAEKQAARAALKALEPVKTEEELELIRLEVVARKAVNQKRWKDKQKALKLSLEEAAKILTVFDCLETD